MRRVTQTWWEDQRRGQAAAEEMVMQLMCLLAQLVTPATCALPVTRVYKFAYVRLFFFLKVPEANGQPP